MLRFGFLDFTYPIVQLSDPCLSRILDRRVQEDDLILDPDLVYDRLDRHMLFKELDRRWSVDSIPNGEHENCRPSRP